MGNYCDFTGSVSRSVLILYSDMDIDTIDTIDTIDAMQNKKRNANKQEKRKKEKGVNKRENTAEPIS
ncbi:hypothetical protein DAPK24_012140 [Pichia kluyveri]|uniref:Uncharacterized protein n=1 Tax=Pichia kluyveri TaxID=36015 RepID=A0AAV5QZL6_PICKL|nr:hypothetical protein DAPK24_012140 [Pichia kluyveri]